MDDATARMQHHPVKVTKAGKRASQRQPTMPITGSRPHAWLKISSHSWVFTNDNSINQYKGLVYFTESYDASKQGYTGVIRTLSRTKQGRSLLFQELDDAQEWVAVQV